MTDNEFRGDAPRPSRKELLEKLAAESARSGSRPDFRETVEPSTEVRGTVRVAESRDPVSRFIDYSSLDAPESWNVSQRLDAPAPRSGYRQKWIREVMLGNDDPHHALNRIREGWRPRPADTIPSGWPVSDGVLRQGGLILMELPDRLVAQRAEHYAQKQQAMDEGLVAEVQAAQHPSHPIHQERKQRATTGHVPVQTD